MKAEKVLRLFTYTAFVLLSALDAFGSTYWIDNSVETSGDGLSRETAFRTWNDAWASLATNLTVSAKAELNVVASKTPYALTATPTNLPGKSALVALRGVNADGTDVESPASVIVDGQCLYRIAPLGGDVNGLTVSGITFRNGKGTGASTGQYENNIGGPAAIAATGGAKNNMITNCTFEGCTDGVAVFMSGEDNTFVDCAFRSNVCRSASALFTSTYGGGAHPGTNRLWRCSFEENGDIDLDTVAARCLLNTETVDCTFRANSGNLQNGSALYVEISSEHPFILSGCIFDGNVNASTEGYQGGAVKISGSVRAMISRCIFRGNVMIGNSNGMSAGCGITFVSKGPYVFTDCLFEGNGTGLNGGCCIASYNQGEIALTNCTFAGNQVGAIVAGGRIHGGAFVVEGCNFTNNVCQGILVIQATGNASFAHVTNVIGRCLFAYNRMNGNSDVRGPICAGLLSLDGCRFIGNATDRSLIFAASGHKDASDAHLTARNCLFVGNEATGTNIDGGDSSVITSHGSNSVEIVNCTFASNLSGRGTVSSYVVGDKLAENASRRMVNVVMSGNTFENYSQSQFWTQLSVSRCFLDFDASNNWAPASMVAEENLGGSAASVPGFKDAAGGDYSLSRDSVCRNAGDNSPWADDAAAVDLVGNPRICEADGGVVDIGCYEYTRILRGFVIGVR